MADLSSVPQDSVLRRHFESARLYGLSLGTSEGIEQPDLAPTDSVLKRHYESARAHVSGGMNTAAPPSSSSNGRASPLTGHSAGPSTVRPAHAAIPRSPTKRNSGGLLGTLRRLFGGE